MISKIGFIGAGKVGTTLGKYFTSNGIQITGYYSRTKANSVESADFTNSLFFNKIENLVDVSELIFITVPDDNIINIWNEIKTLDVRGKTVVHCSGALASGVFLGAKELGVGTLSIHPMFAISSKTESYKDMDKSYFTIEGNSPIKPEIIKSIESMGNEISEIDTDSKVLYHIASVFVSNLVVGLVKEGQELLLKAGLDKDFSENAWKSLFMGNAENIVNKGLTEALTGPVERADYDTVKKHLKSLEGRDEILYKELSRMILDIAKGKHPNRDYTKVNNCLYDDSQEVKDLGE